MPSSVPLPARETSVSRLAKFFPEAVPVRLSVRLKRMSGQATSLEENTVIEFGTSREVLFSTRLPLEFADNLHVENADGSLNVEVSVVALQYQNGSTAVAARFTKAVPHWIVKP